jgi:hypothetical protein
MLATRPSKDVMLQILDIVVGQPVNLPVDATQVDEHWIVGLFAHSVSP